MTTIIVIAFLVLALSVGIFRSLKNSATQAGAQNLNLAAIEVSTEPDLSVLPSQFVVVDLETTGLHPERHEILEIGAIKFTKGMETHQTFQALVMPKGRISKKVTEITGIDRRLVQREGGQLADELPQFLDFIGNLPLVSYNAPFDMGFLDAAVSRHIPDRRITNITFCALKMAREAWPGLHSYRLGDLAQAAGLPMENQHRALGDCERTLIIYCHAASKLGRKNPSVALARSKEHRPTKMDLPKSNSDADPSNPFYGLHVCFSGNQLMDKKRAMELVAHAGGFPEIGVNKRLDVLVYTITSTTKYRKAQEHIAKGQKIELLSESDFIRIIGNT